VERAGRIDNWGLGCAPPTTTKTTLCDLRQQVLTTKAQKGGTGGGKVRESVPGTWIACLQGLQTSLCPKLLKRDHCCSPRQRERFRLCAKVDSERLLRTKRGRGGSSGGRFAHFSASMSLQRFFRFRSTSTCIRGSLSALSGARAPINYRLQQAGARTSPFADPAARRLPHILLAAPEPVSQFRAIFSGLRD